MIGLLETQPDSAFNVHKENTPLVEGCRMTQSLDQLLRSYQCRVKQKRGLEEKRETDYISFKLN